MSTVCLSLVVSALNIESQMKPNTDKRQEMTGLEPQEHSETEEQNDDGDGSQIRSPDPSHELKREGAAPPADEDYIYIEPSEFAKSSATYEEGSDPDEEEGMIVYNEGEQKE